MSPSQINRRNDVLKCAAHIEWCVKRANRAYHKFPNRTFRRECTTSPRTDRSGLYVYTWCIHRCGAVPATRRRQSVDMYAGRLYENLRASISRRYSPFPKYTTRDTTRRRRGWRTVGKHMSSYATGDNVLIGLWDVYPHACASLRTTAYNLHKDMAHEMTKARNIILWVRQLWLNYWLANNVLLTLPFICYLLYHVYHICYISISITIIYI